MRTATWVCLLGVVTSLTAYLTWSVAEPKAISPPYEAVGSVKGIMKGIVDPAADVVFESVAVVSDAAGTTERTPQTDEEWARVEHNALMLAETANLLRMPGRRVETGEETTKQRGAEELTPDQILEKIDADRAKWNQHAAALMQQAMRAIEHARKRNVEGLYQVGGDLDQVCENCHREYRYRMLLMEQAPGSMAFDVGPCGTMCNRLQVMDLQTLEGAAAKR